MIGDSRLGARLGALARSRHETPAETSSERVDGAVAADEAAVEPAVAANELGVESFLPGGEWRDEHGAVYVHERLRSELEAPQLAWGALDEPGESEPDLRTLHALGLTRALFLDLETGGLASSPVFLAGTMHWNGEDFVLRQYFARDYAEEAALLRALGRQLSGFEVLVTFNGKTYDAPFLRSRGHVHAVPLQIPALHVDLLHASRRRWRGVFEDCRLQTLERRVCRRRRSGDVPSDQIPGLYHDFVRNGDAWRLIPVFHHNALDVITMADLLQALCRAEPQTGGVSGAAQGRRFKSESGMTALPDALEPEQMAGWLAADSFQAPRDELPEIPVDRPPQPRLVMKR
ncbi:MAG: hypothetical protein HOP12_12340 [Candidatus Eisenbacteria bacterium]|uniref:YprB ribonuclease H-like domain-containing protein n=1 Tax=Eiseniibacteriota bacterium TaxID=2212470 RepID=A0A849SQN0_UNCEI|nr:hypothetical protein [Candidatus Eisenbacteria bacterium]